MVQLASGKPVIVAANGGTALVYGAAAITTSQMADLIARSSGFVQVALPADRCDALLIPEAMPTDRASNRSGLGQCVAVDATDGVTTGISAADRAHTARVLCASATTTADLARPGHVVPVRAEISPNPHTSRWSMATIVLALTGEACPSPGAAYAELTSEIDPLHTIRLDETCAIAERTRTTLVHC